MTQLANLPVWAQVLSLGSFMFAGGVFVIGFPLIPIIILSFFYLNNSFTPTDNSDSFILKCPWNWVKVYGAVGILWAMIWIFCGTGGSPVGGGISDRMLLETVVVGVGFIITGLVMVISLIPAFTKWKCLLKTLPGPYWQVVLWRMFFAMGVVQGICRGGRNVILLLGICILSLYAISNGCNRVGKIASGVSGALALFYFFLCY